MEEKLTVFRAGTKDGPSFSFSGDHSAREKNAVVQQPRDVWMVTEPDLYYPLNLRDKNTVRLFKADISPSVFDEIKVQKHFKFHGICVAEGKSTKHLKKQLESLDWKEIKLETCHGGMSLMDFTTLVRAVMVYMKDHYPTTPDEYNFQAELKAASHWYWYPKSNKNPGHEEGDRTSIKLPKLVSGPHKDKRIKIAALKTCKKWISVLKELKTESSPQKRSQRSKEDEQSSPEEDEIEERIYDLEESIFDLKTYFDFKDSGIEEVDPPCRGYFKFGTSTSALNQQNLKTRQATSTYTMAQHVAPALDDVISNTVDIFYNYYKCDYPKSPQVKDGLKHLLNERYRNDVNSFIDHFVHPTQSLLSSLEEEKFPLCLPNGKVVLHLVPPMTKLAVGEFFYQVGHTNPRTLVVKFAKYEQRGTKVNELQRSTVPEDDHDIAFTKEYFDQIRGEVPDGLGDVLMRTLVVMGNPNWTVQREGAANHLGNCPTERRGRLRLESHLSVQESCDDDSSITSEPNSPTENDDVYPSTDGVFVHTNGGDKGK